MMSKIIFCVSLLVAYVHSGPISTEKPAEIIKYIYEPVVGNSGYRFEYETSDHQSKFEEGTFNNGTLRVNGTYTYIDTAGGTHTIRYLSDERGFSSQNVDVAASVDPNSVAKNIPAPRSAPIPVANNVPIVDTITVAATTNKSLSAEHEIVPENLVVRTASESSRVAKNLPAPTNEANPSVGKIAPAVSTTPAPTSTVKNLPVVNNVPAITTTVAPTSVASTTKAVSSATEPDVKNVPAVSTTTTTPTSVTAATTVAVSAEPIVKDVKNVPAVSTTTTVPTSVTAATTEAVSAEPIVKSVPVPINESTSAAKDVTTATPVVTTRASVPLPAAPTVIIP